ncbi:hypothetical protein Y88_3766 [Novosphingobium nitrogenifigens DSM 19370]|uniref:DUF2849 domain-containing protein n=1 Tax=Novosphingobium nitrogenifigens DSM 19370 TaxID=983920 RepID=F1ZDA2_9SPHN|nr:DUF2849 domain-containing protein [Novosphingobium nitrogenifigens]EGD57456.1 hypothetical protein Y88_3766 [Novosphingobium nitrogenifigens DSM 19370]
MKILTGNDLLTGDVTWWTGNGWSRHIADAAPVGDDATQIAQSEEADRKVVGAYVIDAQSDAEGLRPAHIKERIRALGPTVRLDLSLRPNDPAASAWIA